MNNRNDKFHFSHLIVNKILDSFQEDPEVSYLLKRLLERKLELTRETVEKMRSSIPCGKQQSIINVVENKIRLIESLDFARLHSEIYYIL